MAGYPQAPQQPPYRTPQQQQQPRGYYGQGTQIGVYRNVGYGGYPQQQQSGFGRPGEIDAKKKAAKNAMYVAAVIILILGVFLIYKGFTATPPKISERLEGISQKDTAVVGVVCKPCGSLQESSIISVVGKDNYKGIIKGQLGQEIMIAKATGDQIGTLETKDWVRYIDRVE